MKNNKATKRELGMKSHNLSFHKLVSFSHAEYEIKVDISSTQRTNGEVFPPFSK